MSWSAGASIPVRAFTEDRGENADGVMAALLRKMVQVLSPSFATNRLDIQPAAAALREAVQPHRWPCRSPHDQLIVTQLARAIASDLQVGRFVVLHADGDARWSERPSRNEASFRNELRRRVAAALDHRVRGPKTPARFVAEGPPRSQGESVALLSRFLLVMPYWTIESWLYQNTSVAIELCRMKYQGRDVETFRRWAADRARLDEEDAKTLEATSLHKKHNLELATRAYPAAEVYGARASFHAAVEALRACEPLCAALALPPPGSPPPGGEPADA